MVFEYSTLTPRRSLATHLSPRLIAVIIVFGGYFVFATRGVSEILYYYPLNAVFLLAVLYLFEEDAGPKLFLFFADWGITTFVSALCNWVAKWIGGGGPGDFLHLLLYLLSYVIILPLYLRFWRHRVQYVLSLLAKGSPIYALYPFLAFILLIALARATAGDYSILWFVIMVLLEAIIVFSYYLLFLQVYAVYGLAQAEANLKSTERQLRLQKKYYEEVDKGLRRQRELLHDSRHHLVAIASFAKAGRYGDLEDYIETLLKADGDWQPARFCENGVG